MRKKTDDIHLSYELFLYQFQFQFTSYGANEFSVPYNDTM